MAVSSGKGHVVILTWPFTSHPFALFNMTCKIAALTSSVQFSFISTGECNRSILAANNDVVPVNVKSYDVDDGLPKPLEGPITPQEEAGLFVSLVPENFKHGMKEAVTETGRKITCLVTDGILSFGPPPIALSSHLQMKLIAELYNKGHTAEEQTLEAIPGLSKIRISDLPQEVLLRDQSYSDSSPVLHAMEQMSEWLPKASAVFMNFYEELNPPPLTNDLKSKFQSLFHVGFLTIPVPLPPASGEDLTGCLQWLEGQKQTSVVYISFGTLALEASGVPFLWSIKDRYRIHLPEGFVERTSKQGKVVQWAPQSRVLSHTSLGAFVTHCGLNSLAESIVGGVPLIVRPIWTDNLMNTRMVEEEWGIGMRVEGNVITKSGMIMSLELIFQREEGRKMREAVGALKKIVLNAARPHGSAAKDFYALAQLIVNEMN
ncbi:hypothetical protein K2173_016148 [Erythroxylum novogranatense]|uniref:Glycosyltransferase n=1 Tax=Erythroxylum novogranatense TaxID=1862640 RepID=A0AAV8SFD3_9ROSI|nr:hypothetical protein K2173_016148 [Erythroxylum novogranatense]